MIHQDDSLPQVLTEPGACLEAPVESAQPLLYGKREYTTLSENAASTTSCQTTSDPDDYGPDD